MSKPFQSKKTAVVTLVASCLTSSLLMLAAVIVTSIAPRTAFAGSASSEIYQCVFTEPFVSVSYDSSSGTLTTTTPESYEEQPDGTVHVVPVVERGVSFRVKSVGKFEIVKADGTALYELELTGQGSDGMSDTVFPFDVKSRTEELMPMDYLGGCLSTSLPAIQ